MGKVNQPSNLLDRIKRVELDLRKLKSALGLASAIIARGGLTLIQDAFFKMIDDLGVEILYFGPDGDGRQIIRIKREGGSDVFWTGFTLSGNQFWRLSDRFNRELFSDDTESGGIARPWFVVPMHPLFSMAASSTWSYMTVPIASVTSERTLWKGKNGLNAHPYIQINGVWGQASGSNSVTYRLKVNGNTVGTWSTAAGELFEDTRGPYNVAPYLDLNDVRVEVTATASGSGVVACHVYACTLRQTP